MVRFQLRSFQIFTWGEKMLSRISELADSFERSRPKSFLKLERVMMNEKGIIASEADQTQRTIEK